MRTAAGICDPLELPVPKTGGFDEYDHMAAFAAALLLGNDPI